MVPGPPESHLQGVHQPRGKLLLDFLSESLDSKTRACASRGNAFPAGGGEVSSPEGSEGSVRQGQKLVPRDPSQALWEGVHKAVSEGCVLNTLFCFAWKICLKTS